jgi:phospholipid/cholesterol/gamma-HCH transport system substrate-binding protein
MIEAAVGMFLCVGVAAVFVLTLQASSLDKVPSKETYTVRAHFENVGSLRVGAPVAVAGVTIGRVTDITLDRKMFEGVVTMTLGKDFGELPQDSNASILTRGLLGEQYVGITPGGSDEALKDGDEIRLTQPAMVLENLIGQFLYNAGTSQDHQGDQHDKAPEGKHTP